MRHQSSSGVTHLSICKAVVGLKSNKPTADSIAPLNSRLLAKQVPPPTHFFLLTTHFQSNTMGLCGSTLTEEEKKQKAMDRAIDKQLRAAQTANLEVIKLLLLGAGESGKSTIFKQMKLLYGTEKDFSEQTRRNMIGVIHGNIIDAMQTLINYTKLKSHLLRFRVVLLLYFGSIFNELRSIPKSFRCFLIYWSFFDSII